MQHYLLNKNLFSHREFLLIICLFFDSILNKLTLILPPYTKSVLLNVSIQ